MPVFAPAGTITGASAETAGQNTISQNLYNSISSPVDVVYTVTPISAEHCTGKDFTVTVTVNPNVNPNVTVRNISCYGAGDGSIETNISGGVPFTTGEPYLVQWSGSGGFSANTPSISGLVPGTYSLTITDQGGCPFSAQYTISQPDEIKLVSGTVKNVTCHGQVTVEYKFISRYFFCRSTFERHFRILLHIEKVG